MKDKLNLMIMASGSGSNAENLIRYFQFDKHLQVKGVICNNPKAGVLERAKNLNVKTHLISNQEVENEHFLVNLCLDNEIDLVVLAGFLRKMPTDFIQQFPDRILNLHPALLPKFGGKGMYGMKVHQAVIAAQEIESGITIHLVNENYDEGRIIAQFKTPIHAGDDAEALAKKIHDLEQQFLPCVVKDYAESLLKKS